MQAVEHQSISGTSQDVKLPVVVETEQSDTHPRLIRSLWRRLLELPVQYKVLIANAAIIVIGALAGTWVTFWVAHNHESWEFPALATAFAVFGAIASIIVNYVVLRAAFQPIGVLERVASAVRRGDLSIRAETTTFSDPQLAFFAEAFNDTLDALVHDRANLEELTHEVVRAQEEERKRISRELHDDTAQILFAQLLRISAVKESSDGEISRLMSDLEGMTVDALESVRRMALELRPPSLDDLGLVAAIADHCQRVSEQFKIAVTFESRGKGNRLPAEIELVLYRITQEALTNVIKHADAKHVWVDLDRGQSDVTISIRDDGKGLDPTKERRTDSQGHGLGIFGMEERVALAGGTLRLWNRPGGGTEVFALIPLDPAASESSQQSHIPTYSEPFARFIPD
jgi:two-component system sensor histidine kinase UhpB